MGKAPAFQLYAADFDMDTASWTCQQVGVYIRLLLSEWVNGGLPNNMSELSRIARIDVRTFAKMWRQTLAKKFTTNSANMYVNNRLEQEREKQAIRRELQVNKGISGAKKRWENHIAPAIAQAQPDDSSSFSSSSSIFKEEKKHTSKPSVLTCPHQEIISLYHETLPELPAVKLWTSQRQAILRQRWIESADRQSLEWWKGYFLKVKESSFLMGRSNGFKADLEWIIRPKNMPKIIEGRYDDRETVEQESELDKWARKKQAEIDRGKNGTA